MHIDMSNIAHHHFRLLPGAFLHDLRGAVFLGGHVDHGTDAGAVTRPTAVAIFVGFHLLTAAGFLTGIGKNVLQRAGGKGFM